MINIRSLSSRPRPGLVGRYALCALFVACPSLSARAETLNDALSSAYTRNPRIDAERARLRAQDENVSQANAGYRPNISASGDLTYQRQDLQPSSTTDGELYSKGYTVQLVQPIFKGLRVYNSVNQQEALVRSRRELLRSTEQDVLLETVTSYMGVIRDQAIVRLRENNVSVLARELKASQERFAVGEVTRTDVAQAQARRAAAVSALDLARANLKTSRASYERAVGSPPANLQEPRNYEAALPKSLQEAIEIGTHESPAVVASLYNEQAARFGVDKIRGELLPSVQLEASYTDRFDPSRSVKEQEVGTVVGRLSVPIYAGGEVHSRVRQAKHQQVGNLQDIEEARVTAEANVVTEWSRLQAFRAQIESDRAQVEANQTALKGVREEERVGQRTLLDVLNAESELLNSQVTLETTRTNLVVACYRVLASVGRLDALNLGFSAVAYDPEAHYEEVRRKPWGVTITHEDGHIEQVK